MSLVANAPKSLKTVDEYRSSAVVGPGQTALMEETQPQAIQQALSLFDAESRIESPVPPPAAGLMRVTLAPDHSSAVSGGEKSPVEKNAFGLVTSARFGLGEISQFKYDHVGDLCAFNYAGLEWKLSEYGYWQARDKQTDYRVDGRIEVLADGSLKISKDDIVRTIKLSGARVDEHKSGSRTESHKIRNLSSAYDLLARARPITSVWLTSQSVNGIKVNGQQGNENADSPLPPPVLQSSLESTGDGSASSQQPKLASLAQTVRLRQLEEQFADVQGEKLTLQKIKRDCIEYGIKSALELIARVKGQNSAMLLPFLDRLAHIHLEKQHNDLAELVHLRALHIREEFYGSRHPELAGNILGIARIYHLRSNGSRAEQLYREAAELYQKGLRKTVFMCVQGVVSTDKLIAEVESLFTCLINLFELNQNPEAVKKSSQLQEKTITLLLELLEKNPVLDPVLQSSVEHYLSNVQHASSRA